MNTSSCILIFTDLDHVLYMALYGHVFFAMTEEKLAQIKCLICTIQYQLELAPDPRNPSNDKRV